MTLIQDRHDAEDSAAKYKRRTLRVDILRKIRYTSYGVHFRQSKHRLSSVPPSQINVSYGPPELGLERKSSRSQPVASALPSIKILIASEPLSNVR